MADLQTYVQDNKVERERLLSLMKALRESDFARKLPNGWTISVALAHLAFWDLRQTYMLKNWLEQGVQPATIASMNPDAINGPLATLSEVIPTKAVVKLLTEAVEGVDAIVEKLTQAQVDELVNAGLERNIHRALHRRYHLEKIEKALRS